MNTLRNIPVLKIAVGKVLIYSVVVDGGCKMLIYHLNGLHRQFPIPLSVTTVTLRFAIGNDAEFFCRPA
jgi:hypothetical protein